MQQTVITLLIAAGGALFGVVAIAGAYLAARFALRDANGALPKEPPPPAPAYVDIRHEAGRRRETRARRPEPVVDQRGLLVELQRTRTILLGWLTVLEAFALGDAWRATSLRAELGDLNTCNVTLVGDGEVIASYQLTVDILRNQAGRGLPPEVASQVASVRIRLLTALAEQERRLNQGEKPQIAELFRHLDLWGPPRPITEIIRPAKEVPPPPDQDSSLPAAPAPAPAPAPALTAAPDPSPQPPTLEVVSSPAGGDGVSAPAKAGARPAARTKAATPRAELPAPDALPRPKRRTSTSSATRAAASPRPATAPDRPKGSGPVPARLDVEPRAKTTAP